MSGNVTASLPSRMPNQKPGVAPTSYGQQFSPSRPSASPASASLLQHPSNYSSLGSASHPTLPQTPVYQTQQTYSQHPAAATTPGVQHHNAAAPFNQYHSASVAPRSMSQSVSHGSHANAYNPPRQSEVYTLSEAANASIPTDIRNQFQQDDYGKIAFFTAPPLNLSPVPEKVQVLGHSLRYLADKARNKEADEKKRKARAAQLEQEATERLKRIKTEKEDMKQKVFDQAATALKKWAEGMERGTDELYKHMHGEDWEKMRKQDLLQLTSQQEEALRKRKEMEEFQREMKKRDEVKITGSKWI
jgi:chromatin structure-remodeling complex subunit RSC1/2